MDPLTQDVILWVPWALVGSRTAPPNTWISYLCNLLTSFPLKINLDTTDSTYYEQWLMFIIEDLRDSWNITLDLRQVYDLGRQPQRTFNVRYIGHATLIFPNQEVMLEFNLSWS